MKPNNSWIFSLAAVTHSVRKGGERTFHDIAVDREDSEITERDGMLIVCQLLLYIYRYIDELSGIQCQKE